MRDQILEMDRLLNRTGGQGYKIYCLKVVIQLPVRPTFPNMALAERHLFGVVQGTFKNSRSDNKNP